MKLMGLDVYIYNLSFSCVQVSLYHIIFLCNLGGIFNVDVICQKKKNLHWGETELGCS